MVTISNGSGRELRVTRGAFDSIYRQIGYTIIDGGTGHTAPAPHDAPKVGDDYQEDLKEKPIGEMTVQELRDYAAILGIDSEGKGKRALRAEILEHERW